MYKYDLRSLAVTADHIWMDGDDPCRNKMCVFVMRLLSKNHQYAEFVTPEYIHDVAAKKCNDIKPLLHAIMVHLWLDEDTVDRIAYRQVTEARIFRALRWCTIECDGILQQLNQ